MNAIVERFNPLFKPKTVAVVGASTKGTALPNVFIRRIRELGFTGAIYPIHPSAPEIDGFKAYRSLADTPEPVDYTFIAIAGARTTHGEGAGLDPHELEGEVGDVEIRLGHARGQVVRQVGLGEQHHRRGAALAAGVTGDPRAARRSVGARRAVPSTRAAR